MRNEVENSLTSLTGVLRITLLKESILKTINKTMNEVDDRKEGIARTAVITIVLQSS